MKEKKSPLLSVQDLSVTYSSGGKVKNALNGINLDIFPGETVGLVGETGAGKTTTALSIMGLLPERTGRITGGKIFFKDKNILEFSEADMRLIRGANISMIFQDPMSTLNPLTTIGAQIEESIILHSPDRESRRGSKKKVEELLEMVEIPVSRVKAYPLELSGGMKQRVVIAMALACNPDLLIADEPTSALDVTIQAQVLGMIEDLRKTLNMSILLITHDLGIVANTCERVCIMYAGEIVESGLITDLFSKGEHHPYTQGLFDSIPNMFSEARRLKPIGGMMPDPTNLPKGCKFEPRCKRALDICKRVPPKDYRQGSHLIKCYLYEGWGEE